MLMGKYEMGRRLGEGHFGKVKLARHAETGRAFAIKILDRQRILAMKIDEQIKREIATLKLLKHPNVVRLYEALKGKLTEKEGRKLFQQLMDAIGYCHEKGVYHRDLKPENVLVDAKGNIKVSDFGLSALPQNQWKDGLLHTTCGSPNYIAPEVLLNKGYDGSMSDIWSCGVILYVMLTGNLPFDDQNMVVLYQKILKGNAHIPKWLSQGAQDILRKILDPNPITRIDLDGIRAHNWFKQSYAPAVPFNDDEDISMSEGSLNMTEHNGIQGNIAINQINAFQLIGMSSCLDLSGFFEKEDASERKIRFASNHSPAYLFEKIESIVRKMGLQVHKSNGKLKVIQDCKGPANSRGLESLLVSAESTMEAIFLIRQLMERYREQKKDLHMVFIDLEKAYDKVPRNVMWWALEKHKVPTKYITFIKDMYKDATTFVRTCDGNTTDFPINIGLHQGSALSSYLFALVMDEVTRDIQGV